MNAIKYFFSILALIIVLESCKKEVYDDVSFVTSATSPDKLSALLEITQDNTGMVTITPNGESSSSYDIYFGDGTAIPVKVLAGKNTKHKYAEGLYDVKIVGHGISGKTAEAIQKLTVSFKAPENLEATATVDVSNNFQVNVSAKATYETLFKVYYGDVANEVPVSFLEGETVNHTYAAVGTYSVKIVALSGGAATSEVTKTVTIVNPVLLPLNFESTTLNYTFNNFDGGDVTVINNPQSNGINTSTKVAKMIKKPGQVWGGSTINLGAPIDFSANKVFRMKVFSPRVGAKVLLKVENPTDGSIAFEKEVSTTVANTWEDLVFDYNAINTAKVYQRLVLIFELGTSGDGSANFTFLFDDIRLTNVIPSTQMDLPVTFDVAGLNYTVTDFGNNQTIDSADPANASNKVKKTTKLSGAETWAGTTIGTATGFASAIPLVAGSTKMSVKVYSPAAGIKVLLKIEDHANGTKSVETLATTTVANAWETLVFDFVDNASGTPALNFATNYDKASIFFDFGNAGTGKVFYWDDVKFVPGTDVLGIPLTFESAALNYAFIDFDGGGSTLINNPHASGINMSSKVGKMVKSAGQVWGGSVLSLAGPINFSANKTFKMKVYSPRVGAKVLLKVENKDNAGLNFEKEVTTTTANAWEELTFDYSAINTANSYHKVVLIFDLGTVGDGSANFTYFFDDITLN
ncbi:MAG: hypothetical protein JWQ25_1719 [Daejeonella sp.]|nr:hypothetical protein [Daejeonella sp.]